MPSIFYHTSDTASYAPTTGEKSAALPSGTQNSITTYESQYFNPIQTTTNVSASVSSLAQTTAQSGMLARFTTDPLAAQTIGAGTWTTQIRGIESNTNANAFLALSIYIWRPSTTSVVGYIYDSTASLGTEFTGGGGNFQSYNISGSSVTSQRGDVLVAEYWYKATQGKSTSYTVTEQIGTSDNTYLQAPANILLATDRRGIVIS
jgi:hypothetical protein